MRVDNDSQSPASAIFMQPVSNRMRDSPRTDGYWIYALMAHSNDNQRKACYIGQTCNIKRRFREHLRHRIGRGSSPLFEWAAYEGVEVNAIVLAWVDGDQSRASHFEGYWLRLAVEAGFDTPNVHNWGRLPQPSVLAGQPARWPIVEILAASLPLIELGGNVKLTRS
ncbi:GIY-YIG nuclease family protein [Yersinia enterocolitica]|nr:GIY-YIG nuclease family protein [Yersinia enterocolitica]